MPQDIISSAKSYSQLAGIKSCPHCGGRLFFDEEEQEWRCLNCARQLRKPISVNNNRVSANDNSTSTTKTPISTTDNAIITGDKAISISKTDVSVNKNPKKATETPLMSTETPAISKRRRAVIPAHGPERIYKGHSIDGIWWPPREITFRRRQMLFLIKNLPQLREGRWPANPVGSGYVDLPIARKGKAGSRGAYYEIPAGIAAEVEGRLEKCGIDGLILEVVECLEKSEQSLANYLGIPPWSIRKRAKNALRYISGWKRREQSYKEFLR